MKKAWRRLLRLEPVNAHLPAVMSWKLKPGKHKMFSLRRLPQHCGTSKCFFCSEVVYIFKGYIQEQVAHLLMKKNTFGHSEEKVFAQQRQKRAMNKERG